MKASVSKAIIADIKSRGYVEVNGVYYPPNSKEAIEFASRSNPKKRAANKLKTGWVDDERNLENKAKQADMFMKLIDQVLHVDVWPEFYFSERLYRMDYAIPYDRSGNEIKIAIEVQGGIWAKGNSGHSSGTGIKRDMDKSNLAQSLGWVVLKIEPSELLTDKTIQLIKSRL